ncbi:MAG TPA: hypothetical protein VL475_04040, partial [Planctomycetaceae bacterium]|nr:hypothetical protein [Planctomycetaceae bacterium]
MATGSDPPVADQPVAATTNRDEAADSDALMESLDREIRKLESNPKMRANLAQVYATRGWILLQKGEAQKALADFDAAVALDPRMDYARAGRAECFRRMGDTARADAELRQMGVHFDEAASDFLGAYWAELSKSGTIAPTVAGLLVVVAWVIATICNIVVGWS